MINHLAKALNGKYFDLGITIQNELNHPGHEKIIIVETLFHADLLLMLQNVEFDDNIGGDFKTD